MGQCRRTCSTVKKRIPRNSSPNPRKMPEWSPHRVSVESCRQVRSSFILLPRARASALNMPPQQFDVEKLAETSETRSMQNPETRFVCWTSCDNRPKHCPPRSESQTESQAGCHYRLSHAHRRNQTSDTSRQLSLALSVEAKVSDTLRQSSLPKPKEIQTSIPLTSTAVDLARQCGEGFIRSSSQPGQLSEHTSKLTSGRKPSARFHGNHRLQICVDTVRHRRTRTATILPEARPFKPDLA